MNLPDNVLELAAGRIAPMTSPRGKNPHTVVLVAEPVFATLPRVAAAAGRRGRSPAAGPGGREPVRVRRADGPLLLSPAGLYRIPLRDLGGTPLRPAWRHPGDARGLGDGDLGHGARARPVRRPDHPREPDPVADLHGRGG